MSIVTKENNSELYNSLFEDSTIEDAKKVIQNMFNNITPEQFKELKKQAIKNVKEKNTKARKDFEGLGYGINNWKTSIEYFNYDENKNIWFNLDNKTIEIGGIDITMRELNAINKQVEELKWK